MAKRPLQVLCAAWACLGMVCVGPDGPSPSLPEARLTEIRLQLFDPETGRLGARLAWDWPSGERASAFEIYQSFHKDSLGTAVRVLPGTESTTALVGLPDSGTPYTLYYGVRAVLLEATGQRRYGKAIPVDSLRVNPAPEILSPSPRSYRVDRTLEVEVRSSSDGGMVLRQALYERSASGWSGLPDTCLPQLECGRPRYGNQISRDAMVLQAVDPGDTLETLYCVHGDETFEDVGTGRIQSLGCVRFFRTAAP